jgi:hypothetical protein
MARITIELHIQERDALLRLAEQERRSAKAQAELMVVNDLRALGLLPTAPQPIGAAPAAQGVQRDARS